MRKQNRGFSLMELMVAGAVGLLVLAVAVAVFVSLSQTRKQAARTVEVQVDSSAALGRFVDDLQRAGYRYPSPMFAVRVFDNYTPLSVNPHTEGLEFSTEPLTHGALCSTDAGVPGSDVVEVSQGWSGSSPGAVTNVLPYGTCVNAGHCGNATDVCSCNNAEVEFTLAANRQPLQAGETLGADHPILLFVGTGTESGSPSLSDGTACALEVTDIGPTKLRGRYLTSAYLAPITASHTTIACPSVGMQVFRLAKRVRYALCSGAGASTTKADRQIERTEIDGTNGGSVAPVFSPASGLTGGAHFDPGHALPAAVTVQRGVSNLQFELVYKPRFGRKAEPIEGTGQVAIAYAEIESLDSATGQSFRACGAAAGLARGLCRGSIGATHSGDKTLGTPWGVFNTQTPAFLAAGVPSRTPVADYPGLANDLSLMGFDFWGENPAISQNAKVLSPRLIDNRHWPREIWVGLTAVSSKAGAKSSPDFEPNLSNQFFYCDVDGDGHFNPGPTPPTDELLAGGSCKLSGRSTAFTLTAPPDTFTYRQSTRTIKFDNLADEVQP